MTVRRSWTLALAALCLLGMSVVQAQPAPPAKPPGAYAELNGIKLYYELRGSGPVVLQLHGNGGSVEDMAAQTEFFSREYRVLGMDNRGHGRSGLGPGRLTYEQMAEDANALLEQLQLKSVNVLGWSDGGIVGLLLAIKHPDKVGKLAVMGANLRPDGAHDWAQAWVAKEVERVKKLQAGGDRSRDWNHYLQQLDLLGKQPNIPGAQLRKISVPTLVMAGDRDIIRDEHTLELYQQLPRAQLAIFPGATHFIPAQDPARFNAVVHDFFRLPFKRPESRELLEGPPPQPLAR